MFYFRWYHEDVSRSTADTILRKIDMDGAFLVRKSDTSDDETTRYTISFRYVSCKQNEFKSKRRFRETIFATRKARCNIVKRPPGLFLFHMVLPFFGSVEGDHGMRCAVASVFSGSLIYCFKAVPVGFCAPVFLEHG